MSNEIKVHNEIYNTEVDEVEGNATMVITVNGIVTQSIRPTTHEKKGYEIFGLNARLAMRTICNTHT